MRYLINFEAYTWLPAYPPVVNVILIVQSNNIDSLIAEDLLINQASRVSAPSLQKLLL